MLTDNTFPEVIGSPIKAPVTRWKEIPQLPLDAKKNLVWLTLPETLQQPTQHLCALLHILDALVRIETPKSDEELNAVLASINNGSAERSTSLVHYAQQACCRSVARWFANYGMNAPFINLVLLNHIFWRPASCDIKSIAPPPKSVKSIVCPEERIPDILIDLSRFNRILNRLRPNRLAQNDAEADALPPFEQLAEQIKKTHQVIDHFAVDSCKNPLEYIAHHVSIADGSIETNAANSSTVSEQPLAA